jgi:transcriptional regulator with XRE-family HTH domain
MQHRFTVVNPFAELFYSSRVSLYNRHGDLFTVAYKAAFGEAVLRAIGKRRYRRLAEEVGCSPAYISDMVQGRIPNREIVLALARATETEPNKLLALAGLRLEETPDPAELARRLVDAAKTRPKLTREVNREEVLVETYRGMDPEHQDALLEAAVQLRRLQSGVADE